MSRLDQLISQYCLAGVPMVRLGEVCEIQNGDRPKEILENGMYKYVNAGTSESGFCNEKNSSKGAVTTPSHGQGGIGYVGYQNDDFWCGALCYKLYSKNEKKLNARYLYHSLCIKSEAIKLLKSEGGTPFVNKQSLALITIPLPPLPVQEEIVRILDAMSDLVTNLDAEISARQKQYEHAREKLLTFGEEVERKTLGEIANNHDKDRRPITENQRKKGIYPYYGASGIVDYVEGYIYDGDYLLVSEDGANLVMRSTPIAFSIHGKTWVNNHAHVLSFDSSYTHKFVEFYLNSIDLAPWITGKSQPKLNQAMLNTISIPLPSLSVQQSIVERLDKMESLIQNLQAERDLRQKQYEYYREKLLTFERT